MKSTIPHVHFDLKSCSVRQNPINANKRTAVVTLDGTFDDDASWQAVHSKLVDGVKIYVSEDFKGELMMAAQEELGSVERERNLLKLEVSKLTRENELLRTQIQEKDLALSVLEKGLLE